MKKLLSLALVLGLAAGGGYLWWLQSIHFTLLELKDGVVAGDVAKVERYADLEAFAKNVVDVGQATGELMAKDAAGDIGAGLLGAIAGALRGQLDDALVPKLHDELRASIAEGKVAESLGAYRPAEGYEVIGEIEKGDDITHVNFRGTCNGATARARVSFQRIPGEGPLGYGGHWRAMGLEEDAVKALAAACREGQKSGGKAKAKTKTKKGAGAKAPAKG